MMFNCVTQCSSIYPQGNFLAEIVDGIIDALKGLAERIFGEKKEVINRAILANDIRCLTSYAKLQRTMPFNGSHEVAETVQQTLIKKVRDVAKHLSTGDLVGVERVQTQEELVKCALLAGDFGGVIQGYYEMNGTDGKTCLEGVVLQLQDEGYSQLVADYRRLAFLLSTNNLA